VLKVTKPIHLKEEPIMKSIIQKLAMVGILIGVFNLPAKAGGQKDEGQKVKVQVSRAADVLKGVVHLTDNDVRFRSKDGVCVFVDPMKGPEDSLAVQTGMIKPDLILITHPHGDHFQPVVIQEYLKLNPKATVAGPEEVVKLAKEKGIEGMKTVAPDQKYGLAGVKIQTVPAYFSEGDSHPKTGGWVGYMLLLDGKRYYITGDTEPVPEMAALNADVIFPLLYGCGGNLDLAVKMTEISGAKTVVPVHTSGKIEVIKKFIASLPEGMMSGYYLNGKPVSAP
jgi:L-ascorbate metabolism protein UlaG (beta-lactamase superfamily)